jgi:diguanylate cyclase (GGDEF)-like protein
MQLGPSELENLPALFEASEQLVAVFDARDQLRFANRAFRLALGLSPGELPSWADLLRQGYRSGRGTQVSTTDFEAWLAAAQSRRGKLPFRSFETSLSDGRWLLMCETTLANGWMLCIASDVSGLHTEGRDLRQERDLAQRAAWTDELTQLSNRRYCLERLDALLARDPAVPLSLAVLDLDHFKRINDSFGHDGGDLVLQDFAHLLRQSVRRADIAARLGGEEFVLVLPDTPLPEAERVLQRLLVAVRASQPLALQPEFRYSCSAGLVQADDRGGEGRNALLSRADRALYQAKSEGRDRLITG